MKKFILITITIVMFHTASGQQATRLTNLVDPMIGTAPGNTPSARRHGEGGEQYGNIIPAAGLPFAMTQWTPETRPGEPKCIPPYLYRDSLFTGIRGTHWLSGSCVPDYGSFTVIPIVGKLKFKNYARPFSHRQEVARPGYYSLKINGLTISVTATARCGIMELSLDRDDSLYVLISPNSDKNQGFVRIKNNDIEGYNPAYRIYQGWGKPAGFSGCFSARFSKTSVNQGLFADGHALTGTEGSNQKNIGGYTGFRMKKGEKLIIRIGTSFTGISGAAKNLEQELEGRTFASVKQTAEQTWEQALSSITVHDADVTRKRIFCTALFHAMQMPRLYSDVDGTYPKFSQQYQLAKLPAGGAYYDDFSMWDIYRAQLPLLEILRPKLAANLVQSLILKGEQGGWMPIFPCWNSYTNEMVGDHTAAFIASAWSRGIRNFDLKKGYALLRQNAFDNPPFEAYNNGQGRRALKSYLKYGYIPLEDSVKEAFHQNEQVSRTLEYAYDDYALSLLAKALGKTADYSELTRRAGNYRHVIDPATGLARGRHEDGKWITPYFPDKKIWYITEGTPRQYTFYVPQDISGLNKLMGGGDKLEHALDTLFQKGEYWHGNEPGHQIPFMYNHTRSPWKTQMVVDSILNAEYSDQPGGLSGNDDAGQMSAWYVFASIGFYPLNPAQGDYELCSPRFDSIDIRLPGGKKLSIRCRRQHPGDIYIHSMTINGKVFRGTSISHAQLSQGGRMEVVLGSKPI